MPRAIGLLRIVKGRTGRGHQDLGEGLGPSGVRVNGIHAGYIAGEGIDSYITHDPARAGISLEERTRRQEDEAALRRIPLADEVAGSVVYLASALSAPVTGQSSHVNAGSHMP